MHVQSTRFVSDCIASAGGADNSKFFVSYRVADNAVAMHGLTEATIDLGAIAHNTSLLAKAAGAAHLMAVVKANGFGHGAAQVARTALANGASWLGVTTQAEALQLRSDGIDAP